MKNKSSRARLGRRVLTLALVPVLSFFILASARLGVRTTSAAAATFTVNSTGDGSDNNTADNLCDAGSGSCTLRAAIEQANFTSGTDTIAFNIPGGGVHTITPGTLLPTITDPVIIDGYTQPGSSPNTLANTDNAVLLVQLHGSGLRITAGGSTVQGLAVIRASVGILLETGGGNTVRGNFIGISPANAKEQNNVGLQLVNSSNNTIGGTDAASRNVIAKNTTRNVRMTGSNNTVQGNFIGLDAAGAGSAGDNITMGLLLEPVNSTTPSSGNLIGGTTPGARNVISANNRGGVRIESGGNTVQGNYIGTDPTGTVAMGNLFTGISAFSPLFGPIDVLIGGTTPGAGNLVSGNDQGMNLRGGPGMIIQGNLIGTDVTGTATIPNAGDGIVILFEGLVGGTMPGARNVISGNGDNPFEANLKIGGGTPSGPGVTVQGNYIGTDITGTVALNNAANGVRIEGPTNLIGGTVPEARNVISGNQAGISLDGNVSRTATNNLIKGNFIGLNAAGTAALPNAGPGVSNFFANGTVIGGAEAGAANQIVHNGGMGILVVSSTGVRMSRNVIHSNGQLGINLGGDGATVNDTGGGDADTGPNFFQNFPTLGAMDSGPASTSIQGTLDSNPNTAYTLEFFSNETCDPSAFGEGQTFIGDTVVTTDASGDAFFNVNFAAVTTGQFITATATDPSGNTSEFSICNQDGNPGRLRMDRPFYNVNENNGTARVVVLRTHGTSGAVTVNLTANTGTATPGIDYTDVSQTLTFADGEALKVIDIPIHDDFTDEPHETVNLVLSDPTGGATLDEPITGQLAILDNDTAFNLSINDVAVSEPLAGTAVATFTVILSSPSTSSISFGYNTSDGTATAGADYQTASGTATFAPGETSKRISITVNSDLLSETDETFFVTLNSFLTLARGIGTGTIVSDNTTIFEFNSASYLVNESDHRLTVTVNRLNDASGEATVDYATTDGTASERRDYTTALGRLRFAPGETSKTFDVLITEDAYQEPDETIHLALSNPSGGGFTGSNGASDITILANDNPPPAGNPIDDSQTFVRQHYHDFLNREPDAGGLAFWTNEIEQCGADAQCRQVRRANVSAAFFLSIEFSSTGYRVIRFYRASFPGTPQRPRALPRYREFLRDTQELQRGVIVGQGNWQQQLNDNLLAFAREWVQRPDFLAEFPLSMTADDYINKLFANSGVTPTPAEFNIAFDAYNNGGVEGRARALIAVTDSGSVYNKQYNPALVLMQYIGYLRRNPDDAPDNNFGGFDFWLGKVDSFSQPGEDVGNPSVALARIQRAEMVRAFIESIEYRRRFAP